MNKLTKVLSVFLIAGAIGTGVAGAAGCTKKDNGNEHNHDYDTTQWVDNKDGKHGNPCKDNDGALGNLENHVDTDKNGECDKCGAEVEVENPNPGPSDKLIIGEGIDGIIVDGIQEETIVLSKDNTSHTINKDAIKVYLAKGNEKDAQVEAKYLSISLFDPNDDVLTDWTGLSTNGEYTVSIKVINAKMADGLTDITQALNASVVVTIDNAVVANSLTLKEGTTTQKKSVNNTMKADWKFVVERKNGEEIAVDLADVDITAVVTTEVGENLTATVTATVDGVACTGTVTYTITENLSQHTKEYAVHFADMSTGSVAAGTKLIDGDGITLTTQGAGTINNNVIETDDYYFQNRLQYGGATFGTNGKLNSNNRYLTLVVDGASKLTIYWSTNSSGRGVAIWDNSKAMADIIDTTDKPFAIATTTEANKLQKMEVDLPAAGTYYIANTVGDMYFWYFQIETEFEDENGHDTTLGEGTNVLRKVSVSHDDKEHVEKLSVGSKFTVDSGYTVKATYANSVTGKKSVDEHPDNITYWLGEKQLIENETDITEDMIGTDLEITVKIGENAVTGSYKVTIEDSLGVTGASASLKSDVNTEVETADGKVTITLEGSFDITLTGTNADTAQKSITAGSYTGTTSGTIEATNGAQLGVGEYVITLTIHVKVGESEKDFTDTVNLTITKKPEAGELVKVVLGLTSSDVQSFAANAPDFNIPAENLSLQNNTITSAKIVTGNATSQIRQRSGKETTVEGNSYGYTYSTGGTSVVSSKLARRYIEVTLKASGKYKVTVYAMSSSNSSNATPDRYVLLSTTEDGSGYQTATDHCEYDASGAQGSAHEFTITGANSFRVGSDNGIEIYAIVVEPIA